MGWVLLGYLCYVLVCWIGWVKLKLLTGVGVYDLLLVWGNSGEILSWCVLRVVYLYCRWGCGEIRGDVLILLGWLWIGLDFDWSWVKGVFDEGWFFVDITSRSFTVCSMTVLNALKCWSMVLMSAVLLRHSCSLISWLYELSILLRSVLFFSSICFGNFSWLKDDWIV